MAVFSVQDAQSQRFLSVENSPAPLCSISMGGKGGGYTYYIGNSLRQSLSALPAPSGREPLARREGFQLKCKASGRASSPERADFPRPGEDVTAGDKRGNLSRSD